MNNKQRYCFLAFGELALDVTYNENGIIREAGGVSAFNTLYHLSALGEETYAIGGVGADMNAIKAIESLKKSFVNTDHIQLVNKPTNVFYIYKPSEILKDDNAIDIGRASPITGKSTIEWTDKLYTDFPEEFENRNIILLVSNFEPVTRSFVKNMKEKCKNSKVSLDITNGKIFEKYSEDELWEYLKLIDLIQCNEGTLKSLCEKLHVSSSKEFFANTNAEIFTLTRGSNGATFFYRNNGEEKITERKPKEVAPLIDPTGAGDAFHTLLLMSYCRKEYNNEELNADYFDRAFSIANAFSRKVVQIEGARGEPYDIVKYMIQEVMANEENDEKEI